MDEYKVKQLRQMLAHETDDVGGLKALIAYSETHNTDLEGTDDE